MERHIKSQSNLETVYWKVDRHGQVIYEVGLQDGSIIPYDDYVKDPTSLPAITRLPKQRPYWTYALTAFSSLASIFILIIIFFHVI